MATRTRSGNRITAPVFKSKSDFVRDRLHAGRTISQAAADAGIGYAFAYGIAKRAGLNLTSANRRKTRAVAVGEGGIVTVQTTAGPVIVHPDGTVTKPKAKAAAKA